MAPSEALKFTPSYARPPPGYQTPQWMKDAKSASPDGQPPAKKVKLSKFPPAHLDDRRTALTSSKAPTSVDATYGCGPGAVGASPKQLSDNMASPSTTQPPPTYSSAGDASSPSMSASQDAKVDLLQLINDLTTRMDNNERKTSSMRKDFDAKVVGLQGGQREANGICAEDRFDQEQKIARLEEANEKLTSTVKGLESKVARLSDPRNKATATPTVKAAATQTLKDAATQTVSDAATQTVNTSGSAADGGDATTIGELKKKLKAVAREAAKVHEMEKTMEKHEKRIKELTDTGKLWSRDLKKECRCRAGRRQAKGAWKAIIIMRAVDVAWDGMAFGVGNSVGSLPLDTLRCRLDAP